MKKEVLQVKGMGSQHCAMIVKGALTPFHTNVEVDLPNKTVIVEYDEKHVSLEVLKAAIEDKGYNVI
ncbi:heavy-metal-associated domain-containing protein [Shimazuella kribbensis]|uniref:heavy-metal-associated domain-containing protein n=1 Tax=Shimazuella kribbensis TaxID=139808 RepID=UPI0003FDC46D|nr:cation transporter [Shimazuella kribbensis]